MVTNHQPNTKVKGETKQNMLNYVLLTFRLTWLIPINLPDSRRSKMLETSTPWCPPSTTAKQQKIMYGQKKLASLSYMSGDLCTPSLTFIRASHTSRMTCNRDQYSPVNYTTKQQNNLVVVLEIWKRNDQWSTCKIFPCSSIVQTIVICLEKQARYDKICQGIL